MRARWQWGVLALCGLLVGAAEGVREPGAVLRRQVEFLAAPKLEGRLTGSAGELAAARYIAAELERLGARPLPSADGFLAPFGFTAGTADAGSRLTLHPSEGRDVRFSGTERVRALSFSENANVSGPIVFAGYGLTVPEGQAVVYDSFAGLDVKDKVVLVLRYSPEDTDGEARAALARYSGLRFKALRARELGAKALLVVTGPRSAHAGETIPVSFDAALSGSGIAAASISGEVAERMLRHAGRVLEDVQRALDSGNPHVGGFEIPGVAADLEVKVTRERRQGHNVLGWLPPHGDAPPLPGYVVLGAHFDHLGRGRHGNSLARKGEEDEIHPGADDNASGVAAVLAAAGALASREHRRPVLLAFWSGEELGLLGSSDFVKQAQVPRDQIVAYLNFDMVGRMRDNVLNLQGAGSSSVWPRLVEQLNVAAGFDVRLQDDPYLPTDSATFYQAGIPALSFFTGSHEDYHRPTDIPSRVNYTDLERVGRLAAALAARLGNLEPAPDYLEVVKKSAPAGDRDSVRAFTGTIPDYATEVDGLRLAGVIGGGPADHAGLREGDVIVEFAGRKITNIYDYTYALDAVKIGQPVRVVFLRQGQRQEATVTPTARP